jgi:5-methylcytosine-specific restriction protein A
MPTLNRRRDNAQPRKQDNVRSFYRSRKWTNLSLQHRKHNPLCAECLREGKTKLGDCVDHITPIAAGGDRTNPKNLQTLCNTHHSKKTSKENPGWNG